MRPNGTFHGWEQHPNEWKWRWFGGPIAVVDYDYFFGWSDKVKSIGIQEYLKATSNRIYCAEWLCDVLEDNRADRYLVVRRRSPDDDFAVISHPTHRGPWCSDPVYGVRCPSSQFYTPVA